MKLTIFDKVVAAGDELKAMTTVKELRAWALANGMDNRAAFPRFKIALQGLGIDYDNLKSTAKAEKLAEIEAKVTHELILFSDAKASAGRFGITDAVGDVLWHGRFFDTDDADEQSRAELCAALKAVWLASKIKEAHGFQNMKLTLYIDAQWLTYQDSPKQKGYRLTEQAQKFGLLLDVVWVSGKRNPADKWTVAQGYKKWSDNDLKSVIIAVVEKEAA